MISRGQRPSEIPTPITGNGSVRVYCKCGYYIIKTTPVKYTSYASVGVTEGQATLLSGICVGYDLYLSQTLFPTFMKKIRYFKSISRRRNVLVTSTSQIPLKMYYLHIHVTGAGVY